MSSEMSSFKNSLFTFSFSFNSAVLSSSEAALLSEFLALEASFLLLLEFLVAEVDSPDDLVLSSAETSFLAPRTSEMPDSGNIVEF